MTYTFSISVDREKQLCCIIIQPKECPQPITVSIPFQYVKGCIQHQWGTLVSLPPNPNYCTNPELQPLHRQWHLWGNEVFFTRYVRALCKGPEYLEKERQKHVKYDKESSSEEEEEE